MKLAPVTLPGEPAADREVARSQGLTDEEYGRIVELLGRTPSFTELGVFAVMWSEHCSYKSSRKYLRTLPMNGPGVVGGPGENAGAIDIGDGWVAVFKIESHNHPSFIEPYQGAATGVGGIIRDIFAMGARPLASMNSLKFGSLEHPRTRYLLAGVVAGIGGYGNCVGVPTVAGEVMFDAAYDANILVNAFCLGLVRREHLQSARARGPGNPVIYAGSPTGRDGIHGASLLASAEFDAANESKRPSVQVGDPFTEKLLIEACLEAIQTGAIIALQDMGAAGLSSSSSEMAARGGLGIELELDRVPLREPGLTPYEMLLSESQERMLMVVERGRIEEVTAIFRKWDLEASVIGRITEDGCWRAIYRGELVADVPVQALSDQAPVYDRPLKPAPPVTRHSPTSPPRRPTPEAALRALLASPNAASKRWVFRQYDTLVQSNTVVGPGADAAILRIKGTRRGLALTVDSNPRACALDPYLGTVATVCEAARNLACAGARPVGITNCLNYGNPERPEIMWQFARGVEGLRDAALALQIPVVSGNVSFYNETAGRAIPPTPTIAMVGVLDDWARHVSNCSQASDDTLLIIRTGAPSLAASEYDAIFGSDNDRSVTLAPIDLEREKLLIQRLIEAARTGLIRSAHDVSCGGLLVALAEVCFGGGGCKISQLDESPSELFGEGPSTVILSATDDQLSSIYELFNPLEVRVIGRKIPEPRVRIPAAGIDIDLMRCRQLYEEALPARLDPQ